MRIGLIGLGRIGAFHAEALSRLPAVTSLVVTDAVPAAIQTVVDKYGVEAATLSLAEHRPVRVDEVRGG